MISSVRIKCNDPARWSTLHTPPLPAAWWRDNVRNVIGLTVPSVTVATILLKKTIMKNKNCYSLSFQPNFA